MESTRQPLSRPNLALDKPYMQLICNPYEDISSVNTRVTIDVMQKDLSRDDMLEVLEGFMKAMGYTFSNKESLCIEAYD
tara:strand:+ start:384 stop:620 length:237 start_codon:yes stop_codon:yes gene_type:complete